MQKQKFLRILYIFPVKILAFTTTAATNDWNLNLIQDSLTKGRFKFN